MEWQEPQDVDMWVADAAVRDLQEWRAEYGVMLRNRIHYLRSVMSAVGERLFDGPSGRASDNGPQR